MTPSSKLLKQPPPKALELSKPSNRVTKSFRINNCNNNRKCFRICNKRIMRINHAIELTEVLELSSLKSIETP